MNFIDLFSGIGGFRLGLQRAGHTPVGWVEIDKYARKAYQSMYDTSGEWNATDINKVTDEEWRKFNGTVDIISGGFPCQSFSIAGKREGFLNKTKGTLFFEIARAVKQIKPRIIFLENVKGLLNHDGGDTFRTILSTLDELGYNAEWQLLNSKDFGVPQNRERVYIVGYLRTGSRREVLSIFGENREVNHSTINDLTSNTNPRHGRRGNVIGVDGISPSIIASDYKQPKQILVNPVKINQVGNIAPGKSFNGNPEYGRVYGQDGISPTFKTMQGGGLEPKIVIPVEHGKDGVIVREATKKGFDVAHVGDPINISNQNSKTRRGRVGHGIANTLVTGSEQATLMHDFRIRKLTPKECWRLQAFPDELFENAKSSGLSDSQLYKQAGNSVTVNVIEYVANKINQFVNCEVDT